ncbi:MAG TPA: phosphodiester glycosidase family protein [Thermoanaerobaculia bacterium]|nr:phosphodiester glycosidase family protein [Thermoanaerobaculia bacterium]
MNRKLTLHFISLLLIATAALAQWEPIGPGVDYREIQQSSISAFVTRVDLTNDQIKIISSRETEKGMRTSDWAERTNAIVAINADFFDNKHKPTGLAIGPCGIWEGTRDTRREGVVAVGKGRVEIRPQSEVMTDPPDWVEQAVSGWPLLVDDCRAFSSSKLPGSDAFTRAPHPRTAVGLSRDGRYFYMVVVDGRQEKYPGVTLSRLGAFMREELGVCTAMNLDGGGSSTMVVHGEIRNRPSDGSERSVANHLGVIFTNDDVGCGSSAVQASGGK